ncbi:hypothetical protein Angca_005014, partial [Angiostrongylus cantonensis]
MEKQTPKKHTRKSRSTSRVRTRAQKKGSMEEVVPPNTEITTPMEFKTPPSVQLPFGKPSPKKASTSRQRRVRSHSTMAPVRRSLYEKHESDSSSLHSIQDNVQLSKQKIIEKSRQKAKSNKKIDEENSLLEDRSLVTTAEDANTSLRTARSLNNYESNIATCLKAFAAQCESLSVEMLRKQFYSLPQPDPKDCVVCADPSNVFKNRYSNIPCLDSSRILLEFLLFESGGGYIHANRVTYPLLRNEFIITQGPLPRTVPEFWRMIWQEKVGTIFMLCKNFENGKRKCAEYYSNHIGVPSSFVNGLLTVVLRSRTQESDMFISSIEIKYLKTSRTVIHYHWTGWPDCEAPTENAQTMFTMLRRVRGSKTPVVVHCSAGIGRSGTMVALEMCLMTIANIRPIDIHEIVSSLRQCRAMAVQTFDQYLSLYKLVLQFGQQNGCINNEDVDGFYRVLQAAR